MVISPVHVVCGTSPLERGLQLAISLRNQASPKPSPKSSLGSLDWPKTIEELTKVLPQNTVNQLALGVRLSGMLGMHCEQMPCNKNIVFAPAPSLHMQPRSSLKCAGKHFT